MYIYIYIYQIHVIHKQTIVYRPTEARPFQTRAQTCGGGPQRHVNGVVSKNENTLILSIYMVSIIE